MNERVMSVLKRHEGRVERKVRAQAQVNTGANSSKDE